MQSGGVAEWTSTDWVAVLGAAGTFVGGLLAGFLKLLQEFRKSAVKVEQVHQLVNNQLDTMRSERDDARDNVEILTEEKKDRDIKHE